MTAPAPRPGPDVAERLAEVLHQHQPVQRWVNYQWEGWGCSCGVMAADFRQHLADALSPVVDAIAAERAAEELEAAAEADDAKPIRWPGASGQWLRARAAALRGEGRG